MSYHVDRFFAAVSVLAGHGHIKQRLIKAFEDNLAEIPDDELPLTVRKSFIELRSQMFRVTPLNGEGAVCASVRKMSIDEASENAEAIVEICRQIVALPENHPAGLPLEDQERAGVPPFLVKSN